MLFDAVPFLQGTSRGASNLSAKAIRSVISLIENRLGVTVAYDARRIPFGRTDLLPQLQLGERLKSLGVITSFSPTMPFPDEPPLKVWKASCNDKGHNMVGGATWQRDSDALTATLAEAMERYIWHEEDDYFEQPIRMSAADMQRRHACIPPERFVSFSPEQRAAHPDWKLSSSDTFLWIRGTSLVSGAKVYVPAQTISGMRNPGVFSKEPLIRQRNTTGLATWPTQAGARLAGALELIERDAYMIMWWNQLTLSKISLNPLRARSASLAQCLDACERYRFKVHAIRLLTDAPTHAVCAVIEDVSGHVPRFAFGLKAHRSVAYAVEKAITEALRARGANRRGFAKGEWNPETKPDAIGHYDRLYYWALPHNAKKLEFLIAGEEKEIEPAPWDSDTPEQQLDRIVAWCKGSTYECVSVSLGTSKKNPTPWSIEMVVIPELQPTHLHEKAQQLGGTRWKTVPEAFGITPRSEQFTAEPHPFA